MTENQTKSRAAQGRGVPGLSQTNGRPDNNLCRRGGGGGFEASEGPASPSEPPAGDLKHDVEPMGPPKHLSLKAHGRYRFQEIASETIFC
jgi:hypothetical protein